jgi:CRISPR/Cas system-associated exonuclease Cas4 (RecB family)
MRYEDYQNRILEKYSKGEFYEEVKKAKEEFLSRAGKVAEGSDLFESQMKAFLDWYLFDRPLNKYGLCPVKMYLFEEAKTLSDQEKKIFEDITKSIHSLFEFLKTKKTDVYIKDMVTGEKYVIEDSEILHGFTKGDIFEGRLIPFCEKYIFGESFVFHPVSCKDFIKKQIKQIRYLDEKQRLKLLHRLSIMKLKTHQYAHIDARDIYTETPLF